MRGGGRVAGEGHRDESACCAGDETGEGLERHAQGRHAVDGLQHVPCLHAHSGSGAVGNDTLHDNAAVAHLPKHDADTAHDGHGAGRGERSMAHLRQTVARCVVACVHAGVWQGARSGQLARVAVVVYAVHHVAQLVSELWRGHQVRLERRRLCLHELER